MSLKKKISIAKARIIDFSLENNIIKSHEDYTKFIILGMGRTGSNYLVSSLQSQKNVSIFGEIFNNANYDRIYWSRPGYKHLEEALRTRRDNPKKFISEMVFSKMPYWVNAVGFKLFYYHGKEDFWKDIWPFLKEMQDLKIVHLKRKNLLETYLSMKYAMIDRQWLIKSNNEAKKKPTIELDFKETLEGFQKIREWENEYDEYFSKQSIHEIYYEDLVNHHGDELSRVQQFLGLPIVKTQATTKKQSHKKLSESIINYNDLKRHFEDSEWSVFFEN